MPRRLGRSAAGIETCALRMSPGGTSTGFLDDEALRAWKYFKACADRVLVLAATRPAFKASELKLMPRAKGAQSDSSRNTAME
mmetsp:Transcript_1113/g.3029  ORF Transcript_1113/g.3029 Transcript_1113/m.3029 type:complete len:83 (-) Transcript_1113:53-301(-)